MRRVLVTGGAGAIGSQLVLDLRRLGSEVLVLDDLSSGFPDNVPEDVRLIRGSVADGGLVSEVLASESFDCVFHLAALFANQNSVDHPDQDLLVNGFGTLNLLRGLVAARQPGAGPRIIYASSSCVYGNASGQLREDATPAPGTPYAITKLLGERYIEFYSRHHGVPAVTVRLFNSYGPGERPGHYRNVIPNFMRLAMRGEALPITGTGEETRDFTYIDDVVSGLLLVATHDRAIGRVYNLGTGRETRIIDVANQILRITGSKSEIEFASRRSWDKVSCRAASVDRARSELGFAASTEIDEGLSKTLEWFRCHPAFLG